MLYNLSKEEIRIVVRNIPEKLYIIKGFTYDDMLIYTKGKIYEESGRERFYILISSKRAL